MAAPRRANGNTESVDNYLKAILSLGGAEQSRVTIKALAERLCVAPASVTNMLQKLAGARHRWWNMSDIAECSYRPEGGARWR